MYIQISDFGEQLEGEEYDDAVEYMKEEWKKKVGRNRERLRTLLNETRLKRREWIFDETPLAIEVLDEFPALGNKQFVSVNFTPLEYLLKRKLLNCL